MKLLVTIQFLVLLKNNFVAFCEATVWDILPDEGHV